MGNLHCITSGCATVIYREYLPPVVRWRYEGEAWQEIEGDDYSIQREEMQCFVPYRFNWRHRPSSTRDWEYFSRGSNSLFPPFSNFKFLFTDNCGKNSENFPVHSDFPNSRCRGRWSFYYEGFDENGNKGSYLNRDYGGNLFTQEATSEYLGSQRADELPDNCGDCILTITKNDEIVHTETRDTCPEVEILPCRLSDVYKEIKIDKVPYLSAIEVIPFARDAEKINGVPYPLNFVRPIPSECLNIYRNELFDPLPSGLPSEENEPGLGDYITQICSVPNCPPPEYEVICDCVERCPPNTCSVVCGSNICCYDSNGISQKSIPISSFFPNNTTGGNPR